VDLTGINADNRAFNLGQNINFQMLAEIPTVSFMHLFYLPDVFAAFQYIVVKLDKVSRGCETRARDFTQRMEVEAVYSPQRKVAYQAVDAPHN
jgi:hypothetical protein